MWFRRLSNFLLLHPFIALSSIFLLTGSTLIEGVKLIPLLMLLMLGGMFSLSYAGLVTLLKGGLVGAAFVGAATLPYLIKLALLFYSAKTGAPDLVIVIGIAFSCILNILIWVIASLIHRGYSWSMLMQSITLFGIFAICLTYVFYPGITEWWVSVLRKPVALAEVQAATVSGQAVVTPEMQKQFLEAVARIATGMMTAGLILCAMLQVMMSRWWQGLLHAPGLLTLELSEIRLTRLTGLLFALGIMISSVGDFYPELNNDLVTAIMPVAYMLFLMAGLNLVHYFFRFISPKARIFWVLFFYIFFVYMAPLSIVLVAMVALFDIWINFRKRFPSV